MPVSRRAPRKRKNGNTLWRSHVGLWRSHIKVVFQADLFKVGDQRIDLHVPASGRAQGNACDVPEAVTTERGLSLDALDAARAHAERKLCLLRRQRACILMQQLQS